MSLTDTFERVIPGWAKKSYAAHWLKLFATLALGIDAIIEGLYQGREASLPGQVSGPGVVGLGGFDSVDALALIGRDRRITRGFTESPADYARRLRAWRRSWMRAGTGFGILDQLRGVLGPNPPTVRLVERSGTWFTIEAGGDLVYNTVVGDGFRVTSAGAVTAEPGEAHPWDWDSLSSPPGPFTGNDFVIDLIIYAPTNEPLTGDGGVYGGGRVFGAQNETIGTTATPQYIEMIQGLGDEWKAAGILIGTIIAAFDAASFNPLATYPDPDMPDGHWGNYGRTIDAGGGELKRVRARLSTARYWRGRG